MSKLQTMLMSKKLDAKIDAIASRDENAKVLLTRISAGVTFLSNLFDKLADARTMVDVAIDGSDYSLLERSEEVLDAIIELSEDKKVEGVLKSLDAITASKKSKTVKEDVAKSLGL